jgi:DNA-directed RNA polymerase specialized sigma subunit
MNKALKIGLITTAIVLPAYLGVRLYLRNKSYKEAESRFKENDTEKKLIIMQILINKGVEPSESNIQSYMNYSIDELKNKLNENVDTAPQFTGSADNADNTDDGDAYGWLDDYLGYYSSDYSYGYNDY